MARIVPKEESRLVLRADGRWFQDGEEATHRGVSRFFHHQIRKDEDGNFYLYNSIDVPEKGITLEEHVYFEVEDTAYFVESFDVDEGKLVVTLNTGESQAIDPAAIASNDEGHVYCQLASGDEARFGRHAQSKLEPLLVDSDGQLALRVGDTAHPIGKRR
jgi:hypothetical protein